jgi:DNA-binding transcriptional LysR family regulator
MTTVELRHVRVCLALADELHFGRTAARLRVAQSAVSHTIQDLERELGVTLFVRGRRAVTLTQPGERWVASAREALQVLDRAAQASRQAAAGAAGRLVLRFTMMSGLTVLPRALARFRKSYPKVEISIVPGGTTEQLVAIADGSCDVGFMSLKKDVAPLATEVVEKEALRLVVPTGHRLARRAEVPLGDLAGEKLIFLRQAAEPEIHAFFRRRCVEAGFNPDIVMEIDQLEALLALVAAGVGISCVPGFVRRIRFPGVKAVPLSPTIPAGISAVWDPRTLPATGLRFLELLRAEPRTKTTP